MNSTDIFNPIDLKNIFHSRGLSDLRLGDFVETKKINLPPNAAIFGYCDDEGISLNGGRPGAASAPDAIRAQLYRMTVPFYYDNSFHLLDLGNLVPQKENLFDRHILAGQFLKQNLADPQTKQISLGGGHDYAYVDGKHFIESANKKPLIVNFDAHLDVRPLDKGITSGTPFFRLLEEHPHQFDFVEIGIQSQCNNREHIKWVQSKGGKILFLDQIIQSRRPFEHVVVEFLQNELIQSRPVFLSVDIDGFSSSYAMGCSQAWPMGFIPHHVLPVFQIFYQRWQVQKLGIYEVSPPLDNDNQTAKLAALIAYDYLFS